MIAYCLPEGTGEFDEDLWSMRRSSASMMILDASFRIQAADSSARRLIQHLGAPDHDRLPPRLEEAARKWLGTNTSGPELRIIVVPGLAARAVALHGAETYVVLQLEPLLAREGLRGAAARFRLSPREQDVLRCLIDGDSASEIAQRLEIGEYTVGDYVKRILAKTKVRNRAEMVGKVLGWRSLRRPERAAQA